MLILVLAHLASAHIPHDPVDDVIAPYDVDSSFPWYMVGRPGIPQQIFRSDDGGYTWVDFRDGMQAANDHLTAGGGYSSHHEIVLGAGLKYYYSHDEGSTWIEVPFADGIDDLAVYGDTVYIASTTGLWAGKVGDPPTQLMTNPFTTVFGGENGVAAIQSGGVAWVWDGSAWQSRGKLEGYRTSVLAPDGSYAGSETGAFYRWTGSAWASCGLTPDFDPTSDHAGATRILVDGAYLAVETPRAGPFVSTDNCATWEARYVELEPAYGVPGGVLSDPSAFTALGGRDGYWYTAGWAGFYLSYDYGATWEERPWYDPDTPPLIHGLDDTGDTGDDGASATSRTLSPLRPDCEQGARAVLLLPLLGLLRRRRPS
jgi:hypothetical protein